MGKTFAVIGDPIDHSLSPNIHNAAFKQLGLDCSYIAYRVPRDELEDGIHGLKKIGISGFNVTIPHKVTMMQYLDKTDESCSLIGATNTVTNTDDRLKGYNTDMDGFVDPLVSRRLDVTGADVLLLGAGGASRAIVAGLAKQGVENITIANRTLQKALDMTEFARRIGQDADAVTIEGARDLASRSDVIVNATPLGMKNEPCPIPLDGIGPDTIVYDIVYMPMNTDLIKRAKEKKATIVFGYEMLLGQAAKAFEIWHGAKAPYDAMKRALLGGF